MSNENNNLIPAPAEAQKDPAAAAGDAPQAAEKLVTVVSPRGLNLREGPHYQFEVIDVLADGSVLALLELPRGAEVPGWALVHDGDRTGWVDARFLQAVEE